MILKVRLRFFVLIKILNCLLPDFLDSRVEESLLNLLSFLVMNGHFPGDEIDSSFKFARCTGHINDITGQAHQCIVQELKIPFIFGSFEKQTEHHNLFILIHLCSDFEHILH